LIAAVLVALPLAIAASMGTASARMLPDGERAPVVWSARIDSPQAHNRLLEVDLWVDAQDADGIAAYEYRWNRATIGSIRTTSPVRPVVSMEALQPETRYVLEVRAVDAHGWASEWFSAADITTPAPPTVIVAGDSVASGYHRQWFTSKGDCLDRDYSYGATVHAEIARTLPSQWAPSYRNVAWAGAGLRSMINGGTDSCGDSHGSQVESIARAANPASWNIVIATGGINSTNWSSVVADLTKNTALSITEDGDKAACASAVSDRWNLPARTDTVASGARDFANLVTTETNARLWWTSYYTINGSRLAPGWTPIGSECNDEMRTAMDLLHSTLRTGLGNTAEWIDIDQGVVTTQDWGGWPHPNTDGQAAIGMTIAEAITGW
jgi:hypothetical protein